MRRDEIEGIWLGVVMLSDELIGGAWIVIESKDGMYVIEGDDFDRNGKMAGTFKTMLSEFDDGELQYKYKILKLGDRGEKTGHGVYRFHGSGSHKVWNFDGNFYEDQHERRFYTYGERLKVFIPNRPEYRRLRRPENRPELILKFIEDRKKRFSLEPSDSDIVSIAQANPEREIRKSRNS
jgi:hypothetical protein